MNTKNIINSENKIILYTDNNGDVELRADIEKDTLWATQVQISRLFDVEANTITYHLMEIYESAELTEDSTTRKIRVVQKEGSRNINRLIKYYNLDAIIAVGYRVNSKKATQFRIWATKILHEYLVKGYSLNQHQLAKSNESIEGLHEAITLLESNNNQGPLEGKITFKLTKRMTQKNKA